MTNEPAPTIRYETADPSDPRVTAAVAGYLAELVDRFPGGFDATRSTADIDDGVYLLALAGDEVAGCGAVRRLDRTTAEIKRMWIVPAWRGHGLGRRMLTALEDHARDRGWTEIRLDTNAALTEAIALYERVGYRRIERYNDNPYADLWFARTLE